MKRFLTVLTCLVLLVGVLAAMGCESTPKAGTLRHHYRRDRGG